MPRAKSPPVELLDGSVDHDAVTRSLATVDDAEQRRLASIDQQFNAGASFDLRALMIEHDGLATTMGEAALRMGQIYIVIKEHLPHGEFLQALGDLGVDHRFAQRAMQAARKFADGARRLLAARVDRTKLLALMSEDDDALDLLAEGGTLAGQTLDEIDRMTSRELRAALRAERDGRREDRDTSEQLLASKDQKINQLDRELKARAKRGVAWTETANEIVTEAAGAYERAMECIDQLNALRDAILQGEFGAGEEQGVRLCAQLHLFLAADLANAAAEAHAASEQVFTGYEGVAVAETYAALAAARGAEAEA